MANSFEHSVKISHIGQILILILACSALPALADSVVVCGDELGPGSEVTVAQWIAGPDLIAPIVKRSHWRIKHHKIAGNYCPVFEIDPAQKLYIRAQKADGSIGTANQFGMYSFETSNNPLFTGDYQLFLETEADPDTNLYTWYREPMKIWSNGVVLASPTVGLSTTDKWEDSYPLKNGFEERILQNGATNIVIQ